MKHFQLVLLSILISLPNFAQSLAPGDIAIIGYNSDNPDELAFVCLVDIPSGTELKFTDNGWFSSGSFRSGEGTFTYTFSTNTSAGMIIYPTVTNVAFSGSGDQVLVYQGANSSPSFIFGFNSEGSGVWQSDATSSNTSALPTGLVNGESAVAINEIDNSIYTGITSGSRTELLTAICNKSNWSGSDGTRQTMPTGSFTINNVSTIPDVPIAVVPTNITANSFTASWNPSSGANLYFLDVSEKSNFTPNLVGYDNLDVGNVTEFDVIGLSPETNYYYRVRASNSNGTSSNSNSILVTTIAQQSTIVQFTNSTGSVSETNGTYNINLSISNPDPVNSTNVDIVLTIGESADIDGFTTGSVTFPAGSSEDQMLTLNIVDDGIGEGNEILTFELQNITGGFNPEIGNQSNFDLTIVESEVGDYYNGIDPEKSTFISDLKNRIRNPYTWVPYSQYDETNIKNFAAHNNGDGTKSVFCVYSNFEYIYTGTFTWDVLSREHTFPHSWMPTNPADEPVQRNEYSDQHHIFPTHQDNANAVRSNHPFGEVITPDPTMGIFLDAKFGTDINGNTVYEPRDQHKGDAARAILYMIIRYDDIDGYDWGLNAINDASTRDPQDLDVLLDWNDLDPPDQWEINRNNYVQSIQGNRNPFVDNPEWVKYIDFYEVEYISKRLFFTEYVEGSSDNKALEIFNNTGSEIDLAAEGYVVKIYSNGNEAPNFSQPLSGIVTDGDVFVVANSNSDAAILNVADQTSGSINFNGDDAVVLVRNTEIVDVIGQIGFDPGYEWGSGEISTQNNTIRRKSSIGIGDSDGSDAFDPSIEWNGFAQDSFDGLGSHIVNAGPPTISNLTRLPKIPLVDEDMTITADVTDDINVASVILKYSVDAGVENEVIMNLGIGSTYQTIIDGTNYSDGSLVKYKVYAEDEDGALTISNEQKVFTGTTPIEKIKVLDDIDKRLIYLNTYARIEGVATVESGLFSSTSLDIYLQDATGGINIYKGGELTTILRGFNYLIEGKIDQYNGKAELVPDNLITDIVDAEITSVASFGLHKMNGQGVLPEPVVLTIAQFLDDPETYEGMLIGIQHLTKNSSDPWPAEGSNANIEITDNGGTDVLTLRIDKDTQIDGAAEPLWPRDITGIFTQFDVAAPYSWGYQIQPRDFEDIQEDGVLPVELITFTASTISTNGSIYINLNWETATEVNNYGFEVERASTSLSISTIPSGDEGWENIGFVEGNGNSNSKKQYLFADNSVSESGKYSYRLKQIDIDGHYKYSQSIDINFGIPEKFEVSQNYPNPFNPSTTISYSIPKRSNVTIEIFNMLGQRITNLIQKEHLPGNYKIDFDASKLSSGIYIYKVSTSNQNIIRKMMILK